MMRSLFSGVTGLKVHQTKMDVIGNNIANVNTVGFKSSSVNFSDILYQTTSAATGPNANTGQAGKNAKQIGLGANVAEITANIDITGGAQRTDNPLDVMINGDNFFIVNSGGTNYFTKSGAFKVDANGTLCTSSGATVMGWQVNDDGTGIIKDQVSALKVMSAENLYANPEPTTRAIITGNIDEMDPELSENGAKVQVSFYDNVGNTYSLQMEIKHKNPSTPKDGLYTVTPVNITDANGNSILAKKKDDGTYEATKYKIKFGGQEFSAGTINATTGEVKFSGTSIDLKFDPGTGSFSYINATGTKNIRLSISDDNGTFSNVTPDETKEKQFSEEGNIYSVSSLPFNDIKIDFSTMTKYATSGKCNLEAQKGNYNNLGAGKKVGNMTGIAIDDAGKIFGSYDNGTTKLLGQIAVTSFANAAGLESVGNSMFKTTQNSGEFDGVGKDPSEDGTGLTTGVLEMSNVDLSSEFTQMITTQRGFQANSRIITTSDTLLEELINLKR